MPTKRLQFQETIGAAPEQVWDTMLEDSTYRIWTEAFSEGSHFVGSWDEGASIHFLGPNGDGGMASRIAESRRPEFLSIEHIGFVTAGVVDTESESVKAWLPAFENYTFRAVSAGTDVIVEIDVTDEYAVYFLGTWPKALTRLKELCETGR